MTTQQNKREIAVGDVIMWTAGHTPTIGKVVGIHGDDLEAFYLDTKYVQPSLIESNIFVADSSSWLASYLEAIRKISNQPLTLTFNEPFSPFITTPSYSAIVKICV